MTHVIWFLACIAVAAIVAKDARMREDLRTAQWQKINAASHAAVTKECELWRRQAQAWEERFEREREERNNLAADVLQRTLSRPRTDDTDDTDDGYQPLTVYEADRLHVETERERRDAARAKQHEREREPLHMEDDDLMPSMRVTAEDDENAGENGE
jgi:hypothetical protein